MNNRLIAKNIKFTQKVLKTPVFSPSLLSPTIEVFKTTINAVPFFWHKNEQVEYYPDVFQTEFKVFHYWLIEEKYFVKYINLIEETLSFNKSKNILFYFDKKGENKKITIKHLKGDRFLDFLNYLNETEKKQWESKRVLEELSGMKLLFKTNVYMPKKYENIKEKWIFDFINLSFH